MKKLLPLIACLLSGPAIAQSLDGVAALEVLPGWQKRDGTHTAALQITLAPGWKTYWRAPGDAGIPPMIDFSPSENISSAKFHWPVPKVFDQGGMRSIGYESVLVIPIELAPATPGAPLRLSGRIDIGVCEEICIPLQFEFDTPLPADGARDPRIVAALVNRPLTADEAGVTQVQCRIQPNDEGLSVTTTLTLPSTGRDESVVVETADPYVWVSEPDVTRNGNQLIATVDMVHAEYASFALDRSGLRFTILGSAHAVDVHGCSAG